MSRAARVLCARVLCALVAAVCCLSALAVAPVPAEASGPARTGPGAALPVQVDPVAPERPPVSIEGLSPSRLRPGRPVRVTGTVFNGTDETWGDVQVGALARSQALTSSRELVAAQRAAAQGVTSDDRIVALGTFDDIGDVLPGQSRSFALTVPYAELGLAGGEGIYQVGAEVRVTEGAGTRTPAGHAWTFMPLVDDARQSPTVELAMLWPMNAPVPRDGARYGDPPLSQEFLVGGRLRSLAELGATADGFPLTWVLDPAVLDAARDMSNGFTRKDEKVDADSVAATSAADWLELVTGSLNGTLALAVPYAHPDVAALAHAGIRPGIRKAQRAGERVLARLRISALSLMWPGEGRADRQVLRASQQFDPDLALLSRPTFTRTPPGAVVGLRTRTTPTTADPDGSTRSWAGLVVDADGNRRGLRAQPGQTTLQWRQLILADTALRSLDGDAARRTAIAMPSEGWWPDAAAGGAELFDGLRVPWVDPVPVTELVPDTPRVYKGGYRYPRSVRRREIGPPLLRAVRRFRRVSTTVDNLLANPLDHRQETDKAFGLASALAWRSRPETGLRLASAFVAENREMVESIDLESPSLVTLSSDSGRFPLSLTNRLEQPVTVQLSVTARDPQMRIAPIGPVTLQQDQRVTVSVVTNSQGVGITTVTAQMHTQTGRPFGRLATFQVRTTQIGVVVWVVMAIGGGVLFVAAARRITLRVRRHRRHLREAT